MKLFDFQVQGVDFLANRKSALLAHEMGLGKSPMAICAFDKIGARKVLIVCKAIGKLNWEREINTWLGYALKIQVLHGRTAKIEPEPEIVIVNYDLLIYPDIFNQITRLKFEVGIFDEAHYLKGRKSKRTKAVLLRGGIAERCTYKWFLTGTPVLNRPIELYPMLKSCAVETIKPYDTYDKFARRYCDAYWDGVQLVDTGASNVFELSDRLNEKFMLRRTKKQVLHQLPDKQYQLISIKPSKKTLELVAKEFTFSKKDAKRVAVESSDHIAVLRHELALSKVHSCVEHIKELLEETKKLVVFAYHKDVIVKLSAALADYGCVTITGDTPSAYRQKNVQDFQKDPSCRVFIGQIQAAGDTITLTAASTVVFVESSWVPGEIDQATDRLHRIGQKNSVLVQFLVIDGSLEERMLRTIIDKKLTIQKIVEPLSDEAKELLS